MAPQASRPLTYLDSHFDQLMLKKADEKTLFLEFLKNGTSRIAALDVESGALRPMGPAPANVADLVSWKMLDSFEGKGLMVATSQKNVSVFTVDKNWTQWSEIALNCCPHLTENDQFDSTIIDEPENNRQYILHKQKKEVICLFLFLYYLFYFFSRILI
jgi:hypothetical protein